MVLKERLVYIMGKCDGKCNDSLKQNYRIIWLYFGSNNFERENLSRKYGEYDDKKT